MRPYLDRIVSNLKRGEQAFKNGKDVHDGIWQNRTG